MDFSGPALTYALLVIPTLFALTVCIQGATKMAKGEHEGPVVVGFGFFLLLLIVATYVLFIR